jgi:hypothetical protein
VSAILCFAGGIYITQALHKSVSCVACHPYAAHLKPSNGAVLLCSDFCGQYAAACNLPADYCAQHASTSGYCYPFATANAVVSNGNVQPYFKNIPSSNDAFSGELAGVLTVSAVCPVITRTAGLYVSLRCIAVLDALRKVLLLRSDSDALSFSINALLFSQCVTRSVCAFRHGKSA